MFLGRTSPYEKYVLHSPEINSFGICFLPAVVTRYNVKSSILKITHAVINFDRLSRTRLFVGESSNWSDFDKPTGFCDTMGDRSSGAWVGGRFGWLKFNNDSLNVFKDCSNHKAGGTAASLYLWLLKNINCSNSWVNLKFFKALLWPMRTIRFSQMKWIIINLESLYWNLQCSSIIKLWMTWSTVWIIENDDYYSTMWVGEDAKKWEGCFVVIITSSIITEM